MDLRLTQNASLEEHAVLSQSVLGFPLECLVMNHEAVGNPISLRVTACGIHIVL